LDATVKIWDVAHERLAHTCRHHSKGVHSFAWCRALSVFVSCGVERDAAVWQGATGRKVGELRGHTSSVLAVAVDEATNHVVGLFCMLWAVASGVRTSMIMQSKHNTNTIKKPNQTLPNKTKQ
jgi:WD40 repeat protein